MYEYIKGELSELTPAYAVVESAGMGYYINISLRTYSEIENLPSIKLWLHYIVREDAQILYGFSTRQEREVFRLLIGVSGVGGNTARMILSTFSPAELAGIVSTENDVLLKNVKGLGLKTAQKIIVELKGKISLAAYGGDTTGGLSAPVVSGNYSEALSALTMLGFPRAASEKVLKKIVAEMPSATVEEIVRMSLKNL